MDGSKPASSARRKGEQLLAFSLDLLAPFEFSGLAYDPLGSIAASVARLAAEDPGQSNDCLMALWAALESDLYRFAKDSGFTAAVDVAARDQPVEYRRFAQLNNLYRDLVELLVPYGQAPRRWTAWLRGQEYHPVLPASLALRMERLLAGRAGQPGIALDSLTRLLAGYGAVVMQPLP
jgi:hypothetical protein